MESYTNLFIAFLSGFCMHIIWSYLVNLGQTVLMFKAVIKDSLIFLAKNIQSVYEINHIKEEAWRLIDRDEKYIEFQKKVDAKELKSLQDTVVRNFINSIPPKHNHLVKFHDWDSAMEYIDKIIKEET
tara:strand:+ start:2283 stop:2666 length:384 start_codon:yes stop_codon:yes gene_type:complete